MKRTERKRLHLTVNCKIHDEVGLSAVMSSPNFLPWFFFNLFRKQRITIDVKSSEVKL